MGWLVDWVVGWGVGGWSGGGGGGAEHDLVIGGVRYLSQAKKMVSLIPYPWISQARSKPFQESHFP